MEIKKPRMELTRKQLFLRESLQFKLESDLEFALGAHGSQYSTESIDKVKKHLEQKSASRKSPRYMRTVISMAAKFPDEHDYRWCSEYRKLATIGSAEPVGRKCGRAPRAAPHLILFGTLYTPIETCAEIVQNLAGNWFKLHRNDIFRKSDTFRGPEPNPELAELERKMYEEKYQDRQMEGLIGKERNRIQTPVLHVETREELEDPNLKRILNSASITVVSGICKASGIDVSKFELAELERIAPESTTIEVLFQNPQSCDANYDSEGRRTWWTPFFREDRKLRWYGEYIRTRQEQAGKYLEQMANSADLQATESSILSSIMTEQPDIPEEADASMFWSAFGTNFDLLDRELYVEQHKNLDKLPEFLRPRFPGNLLNLIGEDVLGINTVQLYAKAPGARTAAHMENALMASININLGPGACVWFAVPYEYWGRLAELVKSKGWEYHGQNYWPDEEELREHNIPVQKFEQKKDELVYVNTGCFHWVQASGYCINVSWNVGQPSALQMSTSMISSAHCVLSRHQENVPVMRIAWQIAKEKLHTSNQQMVKIIRSIMIRTLAHVTWYEDEIKANGKKIIEIRDFGFPIPPNIRCMMCGAEVFNIVKWFIGNPQIDSTYFCNRCNPKYSRADLTQGRFEAYTIQTPRSELAEILDNYQFVAAE